MAGRPGSTFGWLVAARAAADRPPAAPRLLLRLAALPGAPVIGSIEPALAARLAAAGLPLRIVEEDGAGACRVEGPPVESLDAVAERLIADGARRRDERLAVAAADAPDAALATIERGVVRALGIATIAVHLVVSTRGGAVWAQQRAFDKATDPGLWDTTMGGQVAHGESVAEALARETMEEAGLALADLDGLREEPPIVVRRPVAEGYMVERIVVFAARAGDALRPVNRDGEVERFEALDAGALERRLAAGAFTLEAMLILGRRLEARSAVGAA